MSAEIVSTSGVTLTVKFSGRVTFQEFTSTQEAIGDFIRRHDKPGKVRILALLQDFRGWAQDGDWGDTTWLDAHDPFIERIAIVGEKRWEVAILGFTLKGLRKAAIEYFETRALSDALAWLAGANRPTPPS